MCSLLVELSGIVICNVPRHLEVQIDGFFRIHLRNVLRHRSIIIFFFMSELFTMKNSGYVVYV